MKIADQKIVKNNFKFRIIFNDFLVNNFHFLSQRARKNNFHMKIILETCSATSKYPWDVISWLQSTYCVAHDRKLEKIYKKSFRSVKLSIFSTFWGGFTANRPYNSANYMKKVLFFIKISKMLLN